MFFSPQSPGLSYKAFVVRLERSHACRPLISDAPLTRENGEAVCLALGPRSSPRGYHGSIPLVQPFWGSCAPSL